MEVRTEENRAVMLYRPVRVVMRNDLMNRTILVTDLADQFRVILLPVTESLTDDLQSVFLSHERSAPHQ